MQVGVRLAKASEQQQLTVESEKETSNEVTRINITRIRRQKLHAFFKPEIAVNDLLCEGRL